MKKCLLISLLMLAAAMLALSGCETDQTTAPEDTQIDIAITANDFEQIVSQAMADKPDDYQSQSAVKTSDPDTLTLTVRRLPGQGGYFYWEVKQDIQVSGEARAYYLPFEVSTTDPNGWTLVSSELGDIYDYEPGGTAAGTGLESGYPYSMHVKVGWDYPTYTTSGTYAVFVFRNNSAFLQNKPGFSVAWKDDGNDPTVLLRDEDGYPIYDYILID